MNLCFIYFILNKREKQMQLATVIMADTTGTTDKVDSSMYPIDILQKMGAWVFQDKGTRTAFYFLGTQDSHFSFWDPGQ